MRPPVVLDRNDEVMSMVVAVGMVAVVTVVVMASPLRSKCVRVVNG
jgi:hypothetical protein